MRNGKYIMYSNPANEQEMMTSGDTREKAIENMVKRLRYVHKDPSLMLVQRHRGTPMGHYAAVRIHSVHTGQITKDPNFYVLKMKLNFFCYYAEEKAAEAILGAGSVHTDDLPSC